MAGSAGVARLMERAILSDFQYDVNAITAEMTKAITVVAKPPPISTPTANPTMTTNNVNPRTNATLRRLFDLI